MSAHRIHIPGMERLPDGSSRWWPPSAADLAQAEAQILRAELGAERERADGLEQALLTIADALDAESGKGGALREEVERTVRPQTEGPPEGGPAVTRR